MGKYKDRSPTEVAEIALSNLIDRIPLMVDNYRRAMENFAADPRAKERYIRNVSLWVQIARTELAPAFASAAERAKANYLRAKRGYTPTPARAREEVVATQY